MCITAAVRRFRLIISSPPPSGTHGVPEVRDYPFVRSTRPLSR
jgi:hypothetical protein